MMYLKYIKYYYLALTVFALIAPVTIGLGDVLPSLIVMWVSYFMFNAMATKKINNETINVPAQSLTVEKYSKVSFFIMLFAMVFVPLYIKFYTGNSMFSSIQSFLSFNSLGKDSTYSSYQEYFETAGLNEFTLEKLPYVVGGGVLKFCYWAIFIRTFAYKKKPKKIETASVMVVTILYVFLGMARGTSFENFEIIMLTFYTILLREKVIFNRNWFGQKAMRIIISFIILGGLYFIISMSLRFEGNLLNAYNVTNEMRYDPNAVISQIDKNTALILNSFTGYFLFGIYFSSTAINAVWFTSLQGGLSALLPGGIEMLGIGKSYNEAICGRVIDCGAAWIPDLVVLIEKLGLLLFGVLILLIGKLSKKMYYSLIKGSISAALILYIIVLFFLSLPVGNFITSSSSVIIAIILLSACHFLPAGKLIKGYFKAS